MTLVVDASVVFKWFAAEPDSAAAVALLATGETLIAPDLLPAEVLNAAWRSWRRGELLADQARAIPTRLGSLLERLHPSLTLSARAIEMALVLDQPVYDCLYLALAERERTVVVTADRRLIAKVESSPWAELVRALGQESA